jgi:hypothetical protein
MFFMRSPLFYNDDTELLSKGVNPKQVSGQMAWCIEQGAWGKGIASML